ncbi:LysM peptidoglycan-binding domain-containing protein [bacterium]|nr:LysM peptidoglycan-binding domain-containing protein [bacterium]
MKRIAFLSAALSSLPFLFAGCATENELQYDPATASIAQLRSDVRQINDRVSSLGQNVDALQEQFTLVERQSSSAQGAAQQSQQEMRGTLAQLGQQQQAKIDERVRAAFATQAREIEGLNKKMAEIVGASKADSERLQKSVVADITALQRDMKAMQAQLNAYMDRVDRLESRVHAAATAPAPAAATPPAPKRAAPVASAYKRTGTPSSPEIDYNQGYEHTVEVGETLWKIARDYEVSVTDLLNTNPNISDTTALRPGQKLFVPYRKK